MMKSKSTIIFLILTAILSSCNLQNKLIKNHEENKKYSYTANEIIDQIHLSNIAPEWALLEGKVSIIKEDLETKVNAHIIVRKDSVIWISLKAPIGIEILRAMITPDSIYYLNRIERAYFIKPITQIKDIIKFDISYDYLQQILFASPKILGNDYYTEIQDSLTPYCKILSKHDDFPKSQYQTNLKSFKIENLKWIKSDSQRVSIFFNKYTNINNYFYPKECEININSQEELECIINYKDIQFDKRTKIRFNIPKSYDKID